MGQEKAYASEIFLRTVSL